ncbi:MAG: alanyl-tRNA editing protein [Candidatus Kariarchaeaceae archaeon]|jgi:misacylated tRNA(Ala) deacylase
MAKTDLLYNTDSYSTEMEATVIEVLDEGVILDRTVFYPQGGGQPSDRGKLMVEGKEFDVLKLKKQGDQVIHTIDGELNIGDQVKGIVDWEYRYQLMKHHTALHILSAVVWRETEAKVTGGTIYEEKARLDFDLAEFNREMAAEFVEKTNKIILEDHAVQISFLSREEADKDPDLIRTKVNLLPPSITEIRTVKIGDVDLQADGGLHVKSSKEIGSIRLEKVENKGKGRKRISIAVNP